MKKEYINPEMQVVMLQTNSTILAGSGDGTGFDTSKELNGNQGDASQWFDNGGSEDW